MDQTATEEELTMNPRSLAASIITLLSFALANTARGQNELTQLFSAQSAVLVAYQEYHKNEAEKSKLQAQINRIEQSDAPLQALLTQPPILGDAKKHKIEQRRREIGVAAIREQIRENAERTPSLVRTLEEAQEAALTAKRTLKELAAPRIGVESELEMTRRSIAGAASQGGHGENVRRAQAAIEREASIDMRCVKDAQDALTDIQALIRAGRPHEEIQARLASLAGDSPGSQEAVSVLLDVFKEMYKETVLSERMKRMDGLLGKINNLSKLARMIGGGSTDPFEESKFDRIISAVDLTESLVPDSLFSVKGNLKASLLLLKAMAAHWNRAVRPPQIKENLRYLAAGANNPNPLGPDHKKWIKLDRDLPYARIDLASDWSIGFAQKSETTPNLSRRESFEVEVAVPPQFENACLQVVLYHPSGGVVRAPSEHHRMWAAARTGRQTLHAPDFEGHFAVWLLEERINTDPDKNVRSHRPMAAARFKIEPKPAWPGVWDAAWDSNEGNDSGRGPITLRQNGDKVSGTYVSNRMNGTTSTGTVSGTLTGRVLTGTWKRDDGAASGTFEFRLYVDGDRFFGTWNGGSWNGRRK